jgi:hypothetical protein
MNMTQDSEEENSMHEASSDESSFNNSKLNAFNSTQESNNFTDDSINIYKMYSYLSKLLYRIVI